MVTNGDLAGTDIVPWTAPPGLPAELTLLVPGSVAVATFDQWPALLLDERPGLRSGTTAAPRSHHLALLAKGLVTAGLDARPPMVPGWHVHVLESTLIAITDADNWTWWSADDSRDAVRLPDRWLEAARGEGAVALLAGPFGLGEVSAAHLPAAVNQAVWRRTLAFGLVELRSYRHPSPAPEPLSPVPPPTT